MKYERPSAIVVYEILTLKYSVGKKDIEKQSFREATTCYSGPLRELRGRHDPADAGVG
jgi:hypothetical protein